MAEFCGCVRPFYVKALFQRLSTKAYS